MMFYWRFKRNVPCVWVLGYQTDVGSGLVRMGLWNGDMQLPFYLVRQKEYENWRKEAPTP